MRKIIISALAAASVIAATSAAYAGWVWDPYYGRYIYVPCNSCCTRCR